MKFYLKVPRKVPENQSFGLVALVQKLEVIAVALVWEIVPELVVHDVLGLEMDGGRLAFVEREKVADCMEK